MKKTYTRPDLKLTGFSTECVLTASTQEPAAGFDPSKTTEENVNAYIQANGLGSADATVRLIW